MREKQSYKTKYRGKILYISSKNKKIEDIFQGCLRFLDSKETNGSAPGYLFIVNLTELLDHNVPNLSWNNDAELQRLFVEVQKVIHQFLPSFAHLN